MPRNNRILAHCRALSQALLIYVGSYLFLSLIATVIAFPWSTDPLADESSVSSHVDYYQRVYSSGAKSGEDIPLLSTKEERYVRFAGEAARTSRIPEKVSAFVQQYGLQNKKVLEVGAGSGLLQDLVEDFTGLDLSPRAQRFFHKPFVAASATDMPFPSNHFDALWSIWTLEHIPNPEKALLEMRRVVKPEGYLFLYPAFEVNRYVAQGYPVRPYSDFDWKGKFWKATIPIAFSVPAHVLSYHQVKILRALTARLGTGPSRLHFIRLTPNYEEYWMADSDATTSFSAHELYLWFATRGDHCLNCPSEKDLIFSDAPGRHLIVQVRKPGMTPGR